MNELLYFVWYGWVHGEVMYNNTFELTWNSDSWEDPDKNATNKSLLTSQNSIKVG